MGPRGTCQTLFSRIRRQLRIPRVISARLLDCALCGTRVATRDEAIIRERAEGVPLCQSCFELMLKKAAQNPGCRQQRRTFPGDIDEQLAEVLKTTGRTTRRAGDEPSGRRAVAPKP